MAQPFDELKAASLPDSSQPYDVYHSLIVDAVRVIFFFDLNQTDTTAAHQPGIRQVADRLNKPGAYFEMYAMTDRSGSQQLNYQVAKGRYNAVMNDLFSAGVNMVAVLGDDVFAQTRILGEDLWEFLDEEEGGQFFHKLPDGIKGRMGRCVVCYLWASGDLVPQSEFMAAKLRVYTSMHPQAEV